MKRAGIKEQLQVKTENGEEQYAKIKVLMAEDNPVNQKVLNLMLEQNDCQVMIAENGAQALDIYRKHAFDLILMDVQMPVMDGIEATKAIQSLEVYKNNQIPIIAVTANAFEEDRKRILKEGMHDFLPKPIKPNELKSILTKYTSKVSL